MTHNAHLILDTIIQSHDHMTAEELYVKLKTYGYHISMATVYNNLSKLWEEGLIRKVRVKGQPDRYDHTGRHDHLVCCKCGRLSDIKFSDLTDILQSQTGEKILSYDLQVSYVCPECRKAEEAGMNKESTENKQ